MLYVFAMKVKDLVKKLEQQGWKLIRVKGSHHIFVHKKGIRSVVVPIHGKEIPDVFAKAILGQAEKAWLEE